MAAQLSLACVCGVLGAFTELPVSNSKQNVMQKHCPSGSTLIHMVLSIHIVLESSLLRLAWLAWLGYQYY